LIDKLNSDIEIDNQNEVVTYFVNEIIRLNLKGIVVKNASKKFNISKDEANAIYIEVRNELKGKLGKRAWTYLLLGSIFFGVGLFGTLAKTGIIFYGAIGVGFGLILSSIGYFRISLLKS
jgi:hypothetical protein